VADIVDKTIGATFICGTIGPIPFWTWQLPVLMPIAYSDLSAREPSI